MIPWREHYNVKRRLLYVPIYDPSIQRIIKISDGRIKHIITECDLHI